MFSILNFNYSWIPIWITIIISIITWYRLGIIDGLLTLDLISLPFSHYFKAFPGFLILPILTKIMLPVMDFTSMTKPLKPCMGHTSSLAKTDSNIKELPKTFLTSYPNLEVSQPLSFNFWVSSVFTSTRSFYWVKWSTRH